MIRAKGEKNQEPALHIPQSSPAKTPLGAAGVRAAQDPPTWEPLTVQSRRAWPSSHLAASPLHPSIPCFHPHRRSLLPLHRRHVALKLKARGGLGTTKKPSFAGKMSRVVLEVDVNGEELFVVDKVTSISLLLDVLQFLLARLSSPWIKVSSLLLL